jgi:hypothetical protein
MLGEMGNLAISSMKYEKPLRETVEQQRINTGMYTAGHIASTTRSIGQQYRTYTDTQS